jgi:hypothetical protein
VIRLRARAAAVVVTIGIAAIVGARALAQPVLVSRVAGEDMHCSVSSNREEEACAQGLLQTILARAENAFVEENGLRATASELAELIAYNEAFEAHDRDQRRRKLEELSARLAASSDNTERERLAEFHSVLVRLARYEADVDAGAEERVAVPIESMRRWIETAKLNAALYLRYGGSVGVLAAGPYAHGARQTLVLRYVASSAIEVLHDGVRRHFEAALVVPPRVPFKGVSPDFTPFWKRPIPPSYIID